MKKFVENLLFFDDLKDIKQLDLFILNIAFQLIPLKTDNKEHKIIVGDIISAFTHKLISADRNNKIDSYVRYAFIKKFAYFVLSSPKEEIKDYLKPFLDNFNNSETISDLLNEFIYAEDHLYTYENFWAIWDLFNPKVIELCTDREENRYTENIVKSYLFAQIYWKENTTEWRTLKSENKKFFKNISEKIGYYPQVLYAISKLLNDIGSPYLNDGVSWISGILQNNKSLLDVKLETNTIYYLENLGKKYIYENREKIRKTKKLKLEVLTILNFLINKGSVVGYMLRETIM